MVNLETAFIIFLISYIVFTPTLVLLIESRIKQIEYQIETLLVEYVKLKQKINNLKDSS
jgi:cell division protein FtsL